jgi:serine/threonine protein kinase
MKPGFKVGQFVVERPLGDGGMAEVWLGRNQHIGTPVAIKFLNAQFASRPDIEARFLNEGKRQGALDHPNIVKVFGFEYVGSQSFLILQYIEGEPLDVRLQRGPLSKEEALRVSTGVLNALQFAHTNGVVHRDVKPSNILLDRGGHPYLGDFGIVLAVNDARMTTTGTSMGTPHYMSPEQIARPIEVDQRADIYSFGCVLFEMLTGRVPFDPPASQGNTDFNVKLAHLQSAPPAPRSYNPAIPPAVEGVVQRCLAKEPGQRYATCAELREALVRAMSGTVIELPLPGPVPGPLPDPVPGPVPGPTPDPVPPKPNRLWWGVGAAAAAVIGLGAWLLTPKAPEIESFSASSTTVQAGQPVTLSWSVKNAETVELAMIGREPTTGSIVIQPSQTTLYSLQASNGDKKVSRTVNVVVIPPPQRPRLQETSEVVIRQFELAPSLALPNQPVTMRWDVVGASQVTIGIGRDATHGDVKEPFRSQVMVHAENTTEYTLHARGADGTVVNRTVTLTILPRYVPPVTETPEITSLTMTPETIHSGQTVEVRWAVRGAQKVFLGSQQVDPVGSKMFTLQQNSTATITAEGADGKRITRSAAVTVIPQTSPQPRPESAALAIHQFNAQPRVIYAPGQTVQLRYFYTGAVRATIEPEAGPLLTTTGSGIITVFPRETTNYILTAYAADGSRVQSQVTVVLMNTTSEVRPRPASAGNGGPGWNVQHYHNAVRLTLPTQTGYGNGASACNGVLSVSDGALHFRSFNANDSFDVPFSDVEEVRENKLPLAGSRAFHIKMQNRNYNFVPQQSVQMIVDSINRAMGK